MYAGAEPSTLAVTYNHEPCMHGEGGHAARAHASDAHHTSMRVYEKGPLVDDACLVAIYTCATDTKTRRHLSSDFGRSRRASADNFRPGRVVASPLLGNLSVSFSCVTGPRRLPRPSDQLTVSHETRQFFYQGQNNATYLPWLVLDVSIKRENL